jgi:hypothetical protein
MRAEMNIATRLKALPSLSLVELCTQWNVLFGRPMPPKLRRDLAIRVVAYRMQEVAFGGLKPSTRKHLKRVAKAIAADPHAPLAGSPAIKAGTRLVRQWNGKVHVVTVLAEAFEYGGRRFSNLSEIARLITGTRWSGPLFFGLKAKHKERRDV